MTSAKRIGRMTGLLILVQMICGALVNFALTAPLFGTPGFLVGAAPHSFQIALSVLIGLVLGTLGLAIAIGVFPILRPHVETLAIWFIALAAAGVAIAAVEQMNVMSMLSLSEAYTRASGAEREPIQALRGVVASARNWSHFIHLIFAGSILVVFYTALYRAALVPRALALFGVGASLLQIVAVAMPLFGRDVVFPLLAPLGICQLILALWLMAKGFPEPANARPAGGHA